MANVIFDVGGVLLEWNPGGLLEGYYSDAEERAAMRQAIFLHADWLEFDRGTLAPEALLGRIAGRAGRPVPELNDLFDRILESLHPKTDTIELLASLSAQRVPLYCLSNMPAGIYGKLRERHEFWSLFDGIVISGLVKRVKPEPEIFHYLLEQHDLRAADTVFIDDLPANVEAAKAVGLQAIHFKDAVQCERALRDAMAASSGR